MQVSISSKDFGFTIYCQKSPPSSFVFRAESLHGLLLFHLQQSERCFVHVLYVYFTEVPIKQAPLPSHVNHKEINHLERRHQSLHLRFVRRNWLVPAGEFISDTIN